MILPVTSTFESRLFYMGFLFEFLLCANIGAESSFTYKYVRMIGFCYFPLRDYVRKDRIYKVTVVSRSLIFEDTFRVFDSL